MTSRQWLQPVWCVLLAIVTGCGSNDDQGQASIIDGSGAPVPDMAVSGRVTGFGSVLIDNVPYDTDDAVFYVNGEQAQQAALAVGDYVTLFAKGGSDSAKAQTVYLETAVAGEITGVNYVNSTFTVLGQTVTVDVQTSFGASFGASSIDALSVGDAVDVRGVAIGNDEVYATRIEATTSDDLRLSGQVQALDDGQLTFMLSGVAIDYHAVTLNEPLANGDWVSVAGSWQSNVLVLSTLRQREDQRLPAGITLTLSGKASDVAGSQFNLAGRVIELSEQTVYTHGSLADLFDGSEVTLTGTVQGDGSVSATSIDIEHFLGYSRGGIGFISDGEGTMPPVIGVGGFLYEIDDQTVIISISNGVQTALTFDDLRINDAVVIRYQIPEPLPGEFALAKARRIEVVR